MGGFYVVVIGRKPGVFNDWLEAAAQIEGISRARHCKFKSRDQAVTKFEEARVRGEVEVVDADPSVRIPVLPAHSSSLNGSSSQVRLPPPNTTSSGLPNNAYPHPNEPQQRHISATLPIPESSTLVGGGQNTAKQCPELAEASTSSVEQSFAEQIVPPGPQQCSCKASNPKEFYTVGVQTIKHPVIHENKDSDHSRRAPPSSIQRSIDSDLSEPESLVSVEIVDDNRTNSTKPKNRTFDTALPVILSQPSRIHSPNVNPSRQHRVTETGRRHTSLQSFSIPKNTASTSSSKRVLVSVGCDVDGYPSGDESSGPEDVTPRKPQITRRDKGKGKQSSLVFISSDDEPYGHESESDSSDSEIATPSRRPVRNSEVASQRSRETSSQRDVSEQGSRRSGGSMNLRANRENNHDLEEEGNSTPHSFMLEALGLCQPAHEVYEPGSDPRSPIRRAAVVPDDSFPNPGRPSPRPLMMPFPKLYMTP